MYIATNGRPVDDPWVRYIMYTPTEDRCMGDPWVSYIPTNERPITGDPRAISHGSPMGPPRVSHARVSHGSTVVAHGSLMNRSPMMGLLSVTNGPPWVPWVPWVTHEMPMDLP